MNCMPDESIGVIGGTGALGSALVEAWAGVGYRVVIGSRSQEKAQDKARSINQALGSDRVSGATIEAAASRAGIAVLAVPYSTHESTLLRIASHLKGKVLIDTTVPLQPPKVARVRLPAGGSAALEAQALVGEEVDVVSAFQNVGAHNFRSGKAIECDVLVTGDSERARQKAVALANAAGLRAFHAGPLVNSVAAEALTSVLIGINKRYGYPGAGLRITPGHGEDAAGTKSYAPDRLELLSVPGIPAIDDECDLVGILLEAVEKSGVGILDGDVVIVASKLVSKAAGRYIDLTEVDVTPQAQELAEKTGKDARLVTLILGESTRVVRHREGLIIAEHKSGVVLANAGIDFSNVEQPVPEGRALLLPEDPDAAAQEIRREIHDRTGRHTSVILNDSMGRAWRKGTTGHAIGVAGLQPLIDLRGAADLYGRPLATSEVALADELAAAASVVMGQGAERKPVVIVRGLANVPAEGAEADTRESRSAKDLLRNEEEDLFR